MKSRGYGLPNRSAFSIYTFDERDKIAITWILFCGFYIIAGYMAKALEFTYFPMISSVTINPFTMSFQLIYLMLCLTPVALNKKEDYTWKTLLNQR